MTTATGWFSKTVFYVALLMAVLLPTAALGHKFGVLGLEAAFGLLRVCLIGGLFAVIAGVVNIVLGKIKQHPERVMQAWFSIAVALIPVMVMAFQISKATGVPPIHNISTDVDDPPAFDQILAQRGEGTNPSSYGSDVVPRDQLIELQQQAYPQIKTIHSSMAAGDAFGQALEVISRHGLEIVNQDRGRGIIEATATTFWFGFKDDVVIRIQSEEGGAAIDLRSVSRVGQSDLGANAARIERFIREFGN